MQDASHLRIIFDSGRAWYAHFLTNVLCEECFNERNARQSTVREEAIGLMTRMAGPGNVRELENLIERAAILSSTGENFFRGR